MKHLLLIAFLFTYSSPLTAETFYVSPKGSDAADGSEVRPFASLKKAQMVARQLGKTSKILVREGTFYLPEPLVFTAEDSGTTWEAYANELPVISGGLRLETAWKPYKDGIFQTPVPADLTTDQLFVNGVCQRMARYPNFDPNERIFNGFAADSISPARAARWADPTGGFIHAMHRHMWGDYHYRILGKNANNTLNYEGGWQNNRQMGMHENYRFVENIFEELDAPGEWFLNEKTNTLYFYPPPGLDLAKARVEAVRLKSLIEIRGTEKRPVRDIRFKGFKFCHTARTFMANREPLLRSDWTTYRGGAIFFEGTENCVLEDCTLDQVGGNAIFVNKYNRRVVVKGCEIVQAGGNGIAFVGDPQAVRNPLFEYNQRISVSNLDRTPGPLNNNYPKNCLVEDSLIHETGRVEKQTAPIQIAMASHITVRHCSIYDVPRAGINIGDGCWGGHVIEYCDIFDTVKETGDHGSFNSWGRDRYWEVQGLNLNDDKIWDREKQTPLLDTIDPIELRNNRWRCDHGWDIDLDDGSSNYRIYNNLCLNGGLKNREGFYRTVENNVIVNNGFHPHVWYKHSQDIVRKNIFGVDHYLPAGGMPPTPWGAEMDYNLVHREGLKAPRPAVQLSKASQRDLHSLEADALFVDPTRGDFRVRDGSPALQLGFVNFPMDRFGVEKESLKKKARTPDLGKLKNADFSAPKAAKFHYFLGLKLKELEGEEFSAYGVTQKAGGLAVIDGKTVDIAPGDLIQSINAKPVKHFADLVKILQENQAKTLELGLVRKQKNLTVRIASFESITRVNPPLSVSTVRIESITTKPGTKNEPSNTLIDGKLAENYGPVFENGIRSGIYKVELGRAIAIAEIQTWTFNQNGNRGAQKFVIFGSNSPTDPGWELNKMTPLGEVELSPNPGEKFLGSSLKKSDGSALGKFRWLLWAVEPVTNSGENSAFQEFQIIEKK